MGDNSPPPIPATSSLGRNPFAGWHDYPANLATYDPLITDGYGLSGRLMEKASQLFKGDSKAMAVELFEIAGHESAEVWSSRFSSAHCLERHFLTVPLPRTRIIAISQQHSLAPLGTSEESMRKMLTYHQVTPDFLTNLFACGEHPQASDAGSGNFTFHPLAGGGNETIYTLRYVEENGRSHGNPWSIRQTTIYHQRSAQDESIWILLHPREDSTFQMRLKNAISRGEALKRIQADPLKLHLLFLSSYASNWHKYLGYLSTSFMDAADMALTMDLEDVAEYRLSFETLQSLRHLSDKVPPLVAILQASITTIERIGHSYTSSCQSHGPHRFQLEDVNRLSSYSHQLQGYLKSAEILQTRIQGILNLLADALNMRSQATAADLNKYMLGLTKKSVDDSATVRVVGIVSLIYLPATFTATILGMDFFTFEISTSSIGIAKDFWIYLIISIPLTVLTVGWWVVLLARKKARKAALEPQGTEKSTGALGV